MARTTRRPREASFSFRVPADLKAAFKAATEAADRPAAQVLREFMRVYVERRGSPEPGYDEWFRAQVQASIDDIRPAIRHDTVIERTRAVIDRIAAEKTQRAD